MSDLHHSFEVVLYEGEGESVAHEHGIGGNMCLYKGEGAGVSHGLPAGMWRQDLYEGVKSEASCADGVFEKSGAVLDLGSHRQLPQRTNDSTNTSGASDESNFVLLESMLHAY